MPPEKYVAESVVEGLLALGIEGKRVLIPMAKVAREVLPEDFPLLTEKNEEVLKSEELEFFEKLKQGPSSVPLAPAVAQTVPEPVKPQNATAAKPQPPAQSPLQAALQSAAQVAAGNATAASQDGKGEAVDQKVYIPFQLVTPANVADYLSKN